MIRRSTRTSAVTVHDVARAAGVSPMTVSRVINDAPGVAKDTRVKVQKVITHLGFVPNHTARSLSTRRSLWIALVFQHLSHDLGDDSAYVTELQEGVIRRCLENGYHAAVEILSSEEREAGEQLRGLAQQLAPDGMLLAPPLSAATVLQQQLSDLAIPFVRIAPEFEEGAGPCVFLDDRAAAHQMTDYLLSLGHRRIGFVRGHPRYSASRWREEGFLAALREWNVPAAPELLTGGDFTFDSGRHAAQQLLGLGDAAPTAIFASSDDVAAGCLAEAHAHGIAVPVSLSIVGFDDTYISAMLYPPLTTIRQSIRELGYAAAGQLLAVIEGLDPPASIRMPHKLVERQSAAGPRRSGTGQG